MCVCYYKVCVNKHERTKSKAVILYNIDCSSKRIERKGKKVHKYYLSRREANLQTLKERETNKEAIFFSFCSKNSSSSSSSVCSFKKTDALFVKKSNLSRGISRTRHNFKESINTIIDKNNYIPFYRNDDSDDVRRESKQYRY